MPGRGDRDESSSLLFGPRPVPPANLQAEQALLGAILANNKAFHSVVAFLRPEHFADPIHGRIFREAARLILRGRVVDAVLLRDVFEQSGVLDEVGGTAYLAQLLTAMVGILNAADYGRAIHDAWLRRQLIEVSEATAALAYTGAELDGEAQVARAAEAIMDLSSGAAKEAPDVGVGDAARLAIRNAEAMARGDGAGALRTGLATLDSAIGRLMPGWFYVCGARPGMGKTSLSCQVAVAVARQLLDEVIGAPPFSGAGGDVVYFSLEMPAEQTAGWMACQIARVSNDVLVDRLMTPPEAERMLRAHAELDRLPIRVIDAVGLSGPAIALRVRGMHARRRVRLVVVDTLQKLVSARESDREGETAATSRATSALKDLGRQLGCPVVALAHLKRDVDSREDPRPRQSDLLYAGEQDADVAFFLFRAERYLKKRPPEKGVRETEETHAKRVDSWHKEWAAARGRAEVIVGKRRQGPEGTSTLRFDGPTTSFSDIGMAYSEDEPDMWGDANG